MTDAEIKKLIGKVPTSIEVKGTYEIHMKFSDGTLARFYHAQDCCEDVVIEDINGDWDDLIGQPLLVADERTNHGTFVGNSATWTFYTFRGNGGSVDVRWLGMSNGYYSEAVDLKITSSQKESDDD